MAAWSLPLLPTNGLDRSLHAPVLVGLVFVSLFTEVFGWTYAGLVVPGYLAATFAAAPITAVLVMAEGWLTHLGVATVARIIPERTGAWSTAFGRERFFLYIVVAIVIRLFVEGTVVPWATAHYDLAHSRELYSVGLVLVPLIANVFWSSGILHAGPRLLILTGLTYLVVDLVLLRHTNFSLSRFQVANESVALHFLATPKAYLLLLVGAMLGARGNVQYGWDYNGILVPALLAVAWYEPLKLVGTGAEAIILYLLARYLSSIRPFSRVALVGPRRMLFVGILGFFLKLGIGHVLQRLAPKVQLTEYLGFGYILPSLLAVKMWNKLRIGVVLMPTFQVSLTAFLVGNGLGFGLNWLTGTSHAASEVPRIAAPARSLGLAWLSVSHDPPTRPGECSSINRADAVAETIERVARRGFPDPRDLATLNDLGMEVVSDRERWWLVAPKSTNSGSCAGLRVAVAPEHLRRGGTVALLTDVAPFGSSLAVAALAIAEVTSAPLVVAQQGAPSEELTRLVQRISQRFVVVELRTKPQATSRLTVSGTVPSGLNLTAIERAATGSIAVEFAGAHHIDYPVLQLNQGGSEAIASQFLGTQTIESWTGAVRRNIQSRTHELIGDHFEAPTRLEMLLLSSVVLPALESPNGPSSWELAVAWQLGYRVAQSQLGDKQAYILYEPASVHRHGNASWVVRPHAQRALTLEVPAPLWELGTLSYALALFEALDARHLLIAGARPDAKPDGSSDPRRAVGRRSFYQHMHQSALAQGNDVLAIHAVRPDVATDADVIAEGATPVLTEQQRSRLGIELLDLFGQSGLTTAFYSASPAQVSIGAQSDPAFAFAERFAPDRMLRLWFSQNARSRIPYVPPQLGPFGRIIDRSPLDLDVADFTLKRLSAKPGLRGAPQASKACDPDRVSDSVKLWLTENNPFTRLDAKRLGRDCEWHPMLDAMTGAPWLLLLTPGEARLLPLHSATALGTPITLDRSPERLRKAIDLGTAPIRLEAP